MQNAECKIKVETASVSDAVVDFVGEDIIPAS